MLFSFSLNLSEFIIPYQFFSNNLIFFFTIASVILFSDSQGIFSLAPFQRPVPPFCHCPVNITQRGRWMSAGGMTVPWEAVCSELPPPCLAAASLAPGHMEPMGRESLLLVSAPYSFTTHHIFPLESNSFSRNSSVCSKPRHIWCQRNVFWQIYQYFPLKSLGDGIFL